MKRWKTLVAAITSMLSSACSTTPPENVDVVNNFDIHRYLGTWYEIARLDHRFERGLDRVTATYHPRDDGGITVTNRGFNSQQQRWKESTGKGYLTGNPETASLKVSFFGPFYGSYNVIALDDAYRYAMICGPNRNYLWILSRTPTLDDTVKQQLLTTARRYGFDTEQLIWVNQSDNDAAGTNIDGAR